MKILLIADIHGNLPALEAVLRHAQGETPIEKILNMGDSTGYGPFPDEVVRAIQGAAFVNILGNYDKKVLSKSHREESWAQVRTPDKRQLFNWTYHSLSKASRKYLKSLPETHRLTLAGKSILMTHGSPASLTEHLLPEAPPEHFSALAELAEADIVLCGHTHRAFTQRTGKTLFINPGSVGRPDDGNPLASYAILSIEDDTIDVELHRVPYDIMAAIRQMRQTGLPLIFTEVLRQGLNYDDTLVRVGHGPLTDVPDPSGILTVLTDSSISDYLTGGLKGEIASIAPQARVMDISHQVNPGNILEGAQLLAESARFFPAGTVHLAMMDSGIEIQPRALAARINSHYYLAPDNGLLTTVIKTAEWLGEPIEIVQLDQPEYAVLAITSAFLLWLGICSAGAHLTNGVPLTTLGTPITDPVQIKDPQPIRSNGGWEAEVVWVNLSGTLHTNYPSSLLPTDNAKVQITIADETITGISDEITPADSGRLVAFINDRGNLAIMAVHGSAAVRLVAGLGTKIFLQIEE